MKKAVKDKFQQWTNEIDSSYKLILTNDLDSLFTASVLKLLFGCEVGLFYDFKAIYSTQSKFNKSKIIGCDLAIEDYEIKTFCNHVTKMNKDDKVNPLSANLNNFANIYGGKYGSNYFRKWNGSTTLTVLSLYDAFDKLILPNYTELTETQLMILTCIDSYFIGAYHPKHYEAYEYFYKWQYALELEMFQPVFDKYSRADFEKFQQENNLKKTISAVKSQNGYKLHTELSLNYLKEHFPMLDFNLDMTFNNRCNLANPIKSQYYTGQSKHDLNGRVFSLSVINRDKVVYTKFA